MAREKKKEDGERLHAMTLRFRPAVYRRLVWLWKQAKNGANGEALDRQRRLHMSDIIQNAVMEYRRDDLAELEERKKRVARELNAEIAAIDLQIQAVIDKREREKEAELDNAFRAQPATKIACKVSR